MDNIRGKTIVITGAARGIGHATAKARRWLSKQMGNDRVFLDVDALARQTYEDRAQSATGVVD